MPSDNNYIRPYRNRIHCLLSSLYRHIQWHTFSHIGTFLTVLFLSGCCPDVLPETYSPNRVKISQSTAYQQQPEGSTLDIFAFQDDRLKRLDSYQRIEGFEGNTAYAGCYSGAKIFFFCISAGRSTYEWADMNSYSSLNKIRIDLENETRECLTMTGECRISADQDGGNVVLKPLVAEISIDGIGYDFTGTPYAGQTITDMRAYLININATYGLTDHDFRGPERIVNQGMLRKEDLSGFHQKDMIFSELSIKSGRWSQKPDISFLCFPNQGSDDSIGNPCTRLVIEGKIDGMTYYWPISIKRIERNCRYSFNILIRRKGTSDPDTPVDLEECEIQYDIRPWEEKTECGIRF